MPMGCILSTEKSISLNTKKYRSERRAIISASRLQGGSTPLPMAKFKINTTMTKEQLMQKWGDLSRPLKNDIDAVIEYEIAKSKEPQPAPNPIAEAYERWEKINKKTWEKGLWIKKHSNNESMQEDGCVVFSSYFNFNEYPELWELYTEPAKQPEPNPIAEAYERGEKIRLKDWRKSSYIKKQSKKQFIDERGSTLYHHNILGFDTHPEKWELYTESEQVAKPEPQVITDLLEIAISDVFDSFKKIEETKKQMEQEKIQHDAEQPSKPFDRERFERMFRAVIETHEATMNALKQLDAYYATKEGGNNE